MRSLGRTICQYVSRALYASYPLPSDLMYRNANQESDEMMTKGIHTKMFTAALFTTGALYINTLGLENDFGYFHADL